MFNLSKFSTGFVFGFGAGFVSRDLLSNGSSVMRPVIKGFMKAGVTLMEKSRESVVGFTETLEDMLAEVRSERLTKEGVQRAASKRSGASASTTATTASSEPAKAVKATSGHKA